MTGELDPWSYLARVGIRSRSPDDPFLADGDAVCGMRTPIYLTQVRGISKTAKT